jgi:hypothetical protein
MGGASYYRPHRGGEIALGVAALFVLLMVADMTLRLSQVLHTWLLAVSAIGLVGLIVVGLVRSLRGRPDRRLWLEATVVLMLIWLGVFIILGLAALSSGFAQDSPDTANSSNAVAVFGVIVASLIAASISAVLIRKVRARTRQMREVGDHEPVTDRSSESDEVTAGPGVER